MHDVTEHPAALRAFPALRSRVATRHCRSCECEWCAHDPRCFLCGEQGLPGPYPEGAALARRTSQPA